MDNVRQYGWRLHKSRTSSGMVRVEQMIVATGQTFPINGGAQTPSLRTGDLVCKLAGGGAGPCDGTEGGAGATAPWGVVVGIGPQWSAALGKMISADKLASGIAWGTNLGRQSTISIIRVEDGVWEVDCDDKVTATTEALYQAMIGEGVNMVNQGAASEDAIDPILDISSIAHAGTEMWQITGISPTRANRDFSGLYVKLLVENQVRQYSPI